MSCWETSAYWCTTWNFWFFQRSENFQFFNYLRKQIVIFHIWRAAIRFLKIRLLCVCEQLGHGRSHFCANRCLSFCGLSAVHIQKPWVDFSTSRIPSENSLAILPSMFHESSVLPSYIFGYTNGIVIDDPLGTYKCSTGITWKRHWKFTRYIQEISTWKTMCHSSFRQCVIPCACIESPPLPIFVKNRNIPWLLSTFQKDQKEPQEQKNLLAPRGLRIRQVRSCLLSLVLTWRNPNNCLHKHEQTTVEYLSTIPGISDFDGTSFANRAVSCEFLIFEDVRE